jgi:hypothetical protein
VRISLKKQMVGLYEGASVRNFDGIDHTRLDRRAHGYGRAEVRICIAMQIPDDYPQREKSCDLRTLIVVANCRYEAKSTERGQTRPHTSRHEPHAVLLARHSRSLVHRAPVEMESGRHISR